jgi:hypothetical protein
VARPLPETDATPYPEPVPEPAGYASYPEIPRRRRINPLVIAIVSVIPLLAFGGALLYMLAAFGKETSKPPDQPVAPQRRVPETETRDTRVDRADGADEWPSGTSERDRGGGRSAIGGKEVIGIVAGVAALALAYFLPTITALIRAHPNVAGVFVLNLFLGLTGWFWVLAMIWAVWRHAPPAHLPGRAGPERSRTATTCLGLLAFGVGVVLISGLVLLIAAVVRQSERAEAPPADRAPQERGPAAAAVTSSPRGAPDAAGRGREAAEAAPARTAGGPPKGGEGPKGKRARHPEAAVMSLQGLLKDLPKDPGFLFNSDDALDRDKATKWFHDHVTGRWISWTAQIQSVSVDAENVEGRYRVSLATDSERPGRWASITFPALNVPWGERARLGNRPFDTFLFEPGMDTWARTAVTMRNVREPEVVELRKFRGKSAKCYARIETAEFFWIKNQEMRGDLPDLTKLILRLAVEDLLLQIDGQEYPSAGP